MMEVCRRYLHSDIKKIARSLKALDNLRSHKPKSRAELKAFCERVFSISDTFDEHLTPKVHRLWDLQWEHMPQHKQPP